MRQKLGTQDVVYGGSSRIICFWGIQSASAHALILSTENSRIRGSLVVLGKAGEGGEERKGNSTWLHPGSHRGALALALRLMAARQHPGRAHTAAGTGGGAPALPQTGQRLPDPPAQSVKPAHLVWHSRPAVWHAGVPALQPPCQSEQRRSA